MSTGTRKFLYVALALVVLIGAGLYYVASNLNGIVAGIIEEQGSLATQTPVRVSGVDIRLSEASASLSGLTVGNPAGFSGTAIELGEFSLKLDAASLTSDIVVINDVRVSGARINVTQQGRSNNLQALLDNLQALSSGEESSASEGGAKMIIDRFTLERASASVSIPELDEMREVELPTIVVRDIGRQSNGATAAQVSRQLLEPVVSEALSTAATESLKDRATDEISNAVDGLLRGLGRDSDEEPEG